MNKYLEKHPAVTIALVLGVAVTSSFLTLPAAYSASIPQVEDSATEKNPPGDIPDSQVFTVYRSALGFTLKVPEGWARKDGPDGVSFTDKLDGVVVMVSAAASPPSVESVKRDYVPKMEAAGKAVSSVTSTAVFNRTFNGQPPCCCVCWTPPQTGVSGILATNTTLRGVALIGRSTLPPSLKLQTAAVKRLQHPASAQQLARTCSMQKNLTAWNKPAFGVSHHQNTHNPIGV